MINMGDDAKISYVRAVHYSKTLEGSIATNPASGKVKVAGPRQNDQ
jgi:hypothetical protein